MATSHTDACGAERVASRRGAAPDRRAHLAGRLLAAVFLSAVCAAQASGLDGPLLVGGTAAPKGSLTTAQQKVDSHLRRTAWPGATATSRAAMPLVASGETSWRREGRVRVVVKVGGTASTHRAALETAGLEIERVNDRFGLVQGWIADAAVPALAQLAIVRSISPAWPAEHSAGTVTSEGDHASRADLVRQLGYDATGVVVGVISDGIDSLAASRASGDLPAVTVPSDPRCRSGSGDEGTAMLEIVHDLAPGAGLLFSGPSTAPEMIDAIECLASAGAGVIVDDLFFLLEPFFEDGPIALTAADAVAAGVSYHTAAGNYGDGRYLADDYRAGPEDFHDFDPGPGQDILNRVIVPPGGQLLCILQWADPFGASSNDYDLFAVDLQTNAVLDSSLNVQDGTQDPVEAVVFANSGAVALAVGLAVQRFAGLARPLELLCPRTRLQYRSAQFGISGHAARPEVIAVAAIDVGDPGLDHAESFSSQGPSRLFFPSPVIRPKPDLAAFDGVTTTAPGFAPFFGTSAAAPHSAAVAALLLGRNPMLSPAQVQAALASTAVDIEAPGFDLVAGHGRIDALAALDAVGNSTTTTTVSTTTLATTTSTVSTTTLPPTTVPTVPTTTAPTIVTTTSTTLPACTPGDCDGNTCTVGDACVGGACQAGPLLTAGQLSGLVRDATSLATGECAGERRRPVRKIAASLTQAAGLLTQAENTANDRKLHKKLSQARRAARQASQRFGRERARLSPGCAGSLDAAIARALTGLSCLP